MKYNSFTISFHSYCMDENTCNAIHEFSRDEWSSFHGWNKDNEWFIVQNLSMIREHGILDAIQSCDKICGQ
jgi:hypothetical protein